MAFEMAECLAATMVRKLDGKRVDRLAGKLAE